MAWDKTPLQFRVKFEDILTDLAGLDRNQSVTLQIVNAANLRKQAQKLYELRSAAPANDKAESGEDVHLVFLRLNSELSKLAGRIVFALPKTMYYGAFTKRIVSELQKRLNYSTGKRSSTIYKGSLLGTDSQWQHYLDWETIGKLAPPEPEQKQHPQYAATVLRDVKKIKALIPRVYPRFDIPLGVCLPSSIEHE